jgi:hypothetical protein
MCLPFELHLLDTLLCAVPVVAVAVLGHISVLLSARVAVQAWVCLAVERSQCMADCG